LRILFVHQNFPGQYKHLAPALAARGHEVHALTINQQVPLPGVIVHRYKVGRGSTKDIHPWVIDIETKVLRGEACAKAADRLNDAGFVPDVICAHPGWGEALFLREVWPDVPQLHYVEFFYASVGADVGFDPEFGMPDFSMRSRVRLKNANNLLNLNVMDQGLSPTSWQRSTVPAKYRESITVIHDGVDTEVVKPDSAATFSWRSEEGHDLEVRAGDHVLTFVNRNLEPSRGYHVFMRSLPELLFRHPKLQVLIVGGDDVSYGVRPITGSYKERFLAEVEDRIDPARVHFLGRIPYAKYLKLLQVSMAHVYLTYPFVLSWSMLEAMSAGCLVIGSRTPPVEEVIVDGENGLLVEFGSPIQIADAVTRVLSEPEFISSIRKRARNTVIQNYDLRTQCLPKQIDLIEQLAVVQTCRK
jgi:glycosyltransferase involved in cell wall biosynthesis